MSASLSGISMLNSCSRTSASASFCPKLIYHSIEPWNGLPYLLNGHDYLDGVQAVQAEVVGEVGGGGDL